MNLLNKIIGNDKSTVHGLTQDWYIVAEGAEGIQDADTFSGSDAYLKFDFGGKQVRTRSIKNDRTPNWNETFHFRVSPDHAKDIHLKVMDEDTGLDDGMAHAKISRGELPMNPGEEKLLKVPIFHKDLVKGIVRLRVKFLIENQQVPSNQSTVQQQQYPQQQPYGQTMPQQTYGQPMQQQSYGQTQQPVQQQQPQQMQGQPQQPYGQHRY